MSSFCLKKKKITSTENINLTNNGGTIKTPLSKIRLLDISCFKCNSIKNYKNE